MRTFITVIVLTTLAALVSAHAQCVKVEHSPVDLAAYYADTVGRTGDELLSRLERLESEINEPRTIIEERL